MRGGDLRGSGLWLRTLLARGAAQIIGGTSRARFVIGASFRSLGRHDLGTPARGRAQDPVVAHEVEAGRGHEGRELLDELARLEDDVGRSVPPTVPQAIEQTPVVEAGEALCRDRRPRGVAAEPLEAAERRRE
jgi:hypothetical protein